MHADVMIFQQDNVRLQSARTTIDYLAGSNGDGNDDVTDWPPRSPGLSQIKQCVIF